MMGLRLGLGLVRRGGSSDPSAGFALYLPYSATSPTFRNGSNTAATFLGLTGATHARTGAKSRFNAAGTLLTTAAANIPLVVPGSGYYPEAAVTNFLINAGSAVGLVTQTTAALTAVPHTLAFYGTGTVTLTGSSTAGPLVGTGATNRVSLTFTPTAAALTLTVTGSVTYAVLTATAYAYSIIETDATTKNVGADLSLLPIVPADVDFAVWGAMTIQAYNNNGSEPLFAFSDAAAGYAEAMMIYIDSGGQFNAYICSGGVDLYIPGMAGGPYTSGRVVGLLRRKSGKWQFFMKKPDLTRISAAESAVLAMPVLTRMSPGGRFDGLTAKAPVDGVYLKEGTFSDAEIDAILVAA